MSVNYERGNIVRDWLLTQSDVEEQNRMPWDAYHVGSITNYKSNIAYKTSDAGTTPILNTGDSFFFNNNSGIVTAAAPGDYLIDTISGNQGTSWLTKTYDASPYISNTCRLIFHYTSGTSFTGDAQIAEVNIGSTSYTFETNSEGWRTTTANSTIITKDNYLTSTGQTVSVANGTVSNRWSRDIGGTASGSTAIPFTDPGGGSWYLYTETSGNGSSFKDFICDSPTFVVDNATFNMILGMYGATIGTLDIYLRVIS